MPSPGRAPQVRYSHTRVAHPRRRCRPEARPRGSSPWLVPEARLPASTPWLVPTACPCGHVVLDTAEWRLHPDAHMDATRTVPALAQGSMSSLTLRRQSVFAPVKRGEPRSVVCGEWPTPHVSPKGDSARSLEREKLTRFLGPGAVTSGSLGS